MKKFIGSSIFKKENQNDCKLYRTRKLKTAPLEPPVFERHSGIPGFNQEKLSLATVALIGAGGLGSEIGEGLTRKGVGRILIFDHDVVEASNLNRQLFFRKDLGENKALCLAENLSQMGFGNTTLIGYPYPFELAIKENGHIDCSLAIVGVDNDPCRIKVAQYFLKKQTPVVFTAVSEDGNSGYVFIQLSKSDKPCFGCLQPEAAKDVEKGIHRYPCPGTPAIKDILKTMAGMVIFAADTLLMNRNREWNYRVIYLDESIPSGTTQLQKKPNCPLCGLQKEHEDDVS